MRDRDETAGSAASATNFATIRDSSNTPQLNSSSHERAPSATREKRRLPANANADSGRDSGIGRGIDTAMHASALNKALRDFEEPTRPRDVTPGGSPSRKRQRTIKGDR